MQIQPNTVSEARVNKPQRRGDVQKCPVCGSQVDAEAYHCPKCHSFFCFHCRARLLPADCQVQCINQECGYYGKLICEVCDVLAEKEEPAAMYLEPEDGYWPAWLVVVLVSAAVSWYYFSFFWAAGIAIVAYALGGYLLQRAGVNIFGTTTKVEHQRRSSFHTCINCKQPVKELVGATYR